MANYGTTTLSTSQVNKGANAIISKTSALTQVLRSFADLYGQELPGTDGLTVEAWMHEMGVERFVTKNGTKKGYTPGTIRAGWSADMLTESGQMCTFKNVRAKVKIDGTVYAVYTRAQAEQLDGKPVSRYMLTEVADDKWTVALVLKGIKQSRDYATNNDKAVLSELAYEDMQDLCIVKINGKEREIVAVNKSEVYF